MVREMRLLGIDVGAQSVRVSVFDGRGNVLGSSQLPHTIERPYRGWAEANPELWWQAVLDGIKTASAQAKIEPEIIQGIGISNMCPSLVAMDRNGEVLRPAILYQDQRSLPQVEALLSSINLDSIFEVSGNRVAPGTYSASSMRWIKDRESEVFAKAHCFGHANSFLGLRLTGNFGLDWTNASFTGLFETGKRRSWSQELCKAWEIPMEKLPEPLPSWANLGGVSGRAATITGLKEGTPVAMGAADTACSALGAGVTEPGQGFDTAGSSDVLAFCIDKPIFDIRFMNRCHSVPERWLAMGALLSPGAALSWFRNQILSAVEYEILNEEAERSGPGANRVIFLPYMQGERSPIWDSMARGVLFGLSLETTRGDLVRAVMEGTAYGLRQNLEIAVRDLGYSLQEIRLGGGGAKSDLWCQIKADVLDRPLVRLDEEETAVLGAGMLGGIAAGFYRDHQEAVNQAAASRSCTFFPSPELSPAYERVYQIYCELYPRLKEPFQALAQATDYLCFEPSSC